MDKEKEIAYLSNRSIFILEFMGETMEAKDYFQRYIDILKIEVTKKNLRGIRIISKDVNSMANGLPSKAKETLEFQLKNKFVDDLSGDSLTLKKIENILKRGRINNKQEYEIIHQLTQDLAEGDRLFKHIKTFEDMLFLFNKK